MGSKSGGSAKMRVTNYYLSLHIGICAGPVDAVKTIWVGEKKYWTGNVTENTSIERKRPNLFGGYKKEGGVAGVIDFLLGGPAQKVTNTLVSRMGLSSVNDTPGYRGITSLFFHALVPDDLSIAWMDVFQGKMKGGYGSFYWGTQPYLKPVWATVQRIPARDLAPATAPIPRTEEYNLPVFWSVTENFEDISPPDFESDSQINFAASANILRINTLENTDYPSGHMDLHRYLPEGVYTYAKIDFKAISYGDNKGDMPTFRANGILYVEPSPEAGTVNSREFTVNGTQVGVGQPDLDVWYTVESKANGGVNDVTVWRDGVVIAQFSTSRSEVTISSAKWNTEDPFHYSGNMEIDYRNLYLEAGEEIPVAGVYDANPAHIIYECLVNTDWGMGADPDSIDTASFQAASVTLYQEAFGLWLQWQAQSSIEDFINDILEHIKGALYPNPRTGKMTLRLLRDDLDVDNLKEITPDNANMANFSRKGWGETTNEIVVTWTRPETEKEETIRMQDLANIAQQGGVVSSSKNYHGIRTQSLAIRVAERDLREESAPLSSCEVEVNREFWDVTPFDGIKMTWPEYGLNSLVMRVMKVNYGDSNTSVIKLSLMEDVFSLSSASFVAPADGEWQEPGGDPVPVTEARLMPAPAYVVSNNGTDPATVVDPATGLVTLPTNPTTDGAARYDVLEQVTTASGDTVFEEATGDRPFPGEATLDAALTPEPTTAGVLLADLAGQPPGVDELIILGDAALPVDELELALVTAVDTNTGTLTLLRGILDTVPLAWAAGTTVTITTREMWRLLPREYTDGQSVTLRFLTSTASGMLEEEDAPDFVGTALARASLPIRPANVTRNGEGIETEETSYGGDPVVLAWSHRNRLLEDTVMYAWDAASTPLEDLVTYRVESDAYDSNDDLLQADWYAEDVGAVDTHSVDLTVDVPPSGWVRLRFRVVAVREGERNWQNAELTVINLNPPGSITAEYVPVFAPRNVTAEVTQY